MSTQQGLLARLAGVGAVEAMLRELERRNEERHRINVGTLAEIKETGEATNGKVLNHDKRLDLLEDREAQKAKRRARRVTWGQGLTFSFISGVVAIMGTLAATGNLS